MSLLGALPYLTQAQVQIPAPAPAPAPIKPPADSRYEPTPEEQRAAIAAADPARGRIIYDRYCALCHGEAGKGYAADNANAIGHPDFLATAHDGILMSAIDRGRPGTPMAAFGWRFGGPLQLQEMVDLLVYIRRLQTKPKVDAESIVVQGDPVAGAAVYAKQCAECHGSDGKGGTAVSVTNPLLLATVSDGFLWYAITHGRSGTPMPAFKGVLTEQQINDVTMFLRSRARTVKDERPAGDVPRTFSNMVLHANGPAPKFPPLREGRYVAADDLKKAYEAGSRMVVLDARPTSDWLKTHIPGALPVPFYDSEKMAEHLPRDGTWIIAYCGCPHVAADKVVDMLRSKGFKNTAVLDEGIFIWAERGYPLTYGKFISSSSGGAR